MVATSAPPAAPVTRRPAKRTLGALFAGSALMFSAALHGGSLSMTENLPDSVAKPVSDGTGQSTADAASATPPVAASQATAWAPGTAPDRGAPLNEPSIRSAPARDTRQQNDAAQSRPVRAPATPTRTDLTENRFSDSTEQERSVLDDVLVYFTKGSGR
jgi:hypothetical protein